MNNVYKILTLIATSPHEKYFERFSHKILPNICSVQNVDVIINIYSGNVKMNAPCIIRNTYMRTHKPLVWKKILTPLVVRPYDYIWLLDSDVHVNQITIIQVVLFMEHNNILISQPRITPHKKRGSDHNFLNTRGETDVCNIGTNIVEVMTPFFKRSAWSIVFTHVLSRFSDNALKRSVCGIDVLWCPFLQYFTRQNNAVCAIPTSKLVFPVIHMDGKSIESSVMHGMRIERSNGPSHYMQTKIPSRKINETCIYTR